MLLSKQCRTVAGVITASLCLAAAGPAAADNYFLRNFTWFGFVDGKELRERCGPGAPERIRLIHQAVFDQQIRVYEVDRPVPGGPAVLTARVLIKIDYSNFTFSEFFLGTQDRVSQATLDPPAFEALMAALAADGFMAPVPEGLRLPSDGFYWTVSACLGGRFKINGWVFPSERYAALRFPAQLLARDGTGVPAIPPRPTEPGDRLRARGGNHAKNMDLRPAFDIRLTDDGVTGRMPGF